MREATKAPTEPRAPKGEKVKEAPRNSAEEKLERRESLARTFSDLGRARDGERPGPDVRLVATPGLGARIVLDRSSTGLFQPVGGSIFATNETEVPAEIARIVWRVDPRSAVASVPPAIEWVGGPNMPPRPKVPARGELRIGFTLSFNQPRVPPALVATVTSIVLYADGSEVEAAPTSLVVTPPM